MNPWALRNGGELTGRVLLGLLFVLEGSSKIGAYSGAASYMAAFGMPPQLLPVAIAVELGAGVLVMVGWRTRLAAILLAVFCVVAAIVFHTKFGDRNQLIHFEKDLALAGAFLVLWARGAGAYSLDALRARLAVDASRPASQPNSGTG
jgi:putative oxidoreductase